MRICLLSPGGADPVEAAAIARHAELLRGAHEVELIEVPTGLDDLVFAGPGHARSAAALEAVRSRYGDRGPDYLEVRDSDLLGFVPLQARAGGEQVLAATAIGVRVGPSTELRNLHDRVLSQPANLLAAEIGRYQLSRADLLLWPGGECLDLYRRHYGALGVELPPPLRAPAASVPLPHPVRAAAAPDAPLRILYQGRLERWRGVLDLVDACLGLPADGWELTLLGTDTATATMGQSVAFAIEATSGDDPRVRLLAEPAELGDGFDLLAAPARVAAASDEVAAALAAGLPVLATPVGGLVEQVEEGVDGWFAADIGPEALRRELARLLAEREQLERLRPRPSAVGDDEAVLAAYGELADRIDARPTAVHVGERPLVTGIVPYFGASRFVRETVDSLLGQTYSPLEVLIVNDGSFAAEDAILEELGERPRVSVVTQANAGESSARNLGAVLARGEYLVMLDADNAFEPSFVERAVAACERDPDLAYVTCWLRMVDENGIGFDPPHGYAPLGNAVVAADERNWDGDAMALFPRRVFTELGYEYHPEGSMHSDWELYRWLRQEGRFGAVLPSRLGRYRILPESLLRAHGEEIQDYGWNESRDRNLQRGMRWTASQT